MAESIKVAQYFKMAVPDKAGEAVKMLDAVKGAGVNLLAFSGFPRGRKAQLDFMPEDPARFKEVAKYNKWKVQGPKSCFVVHGDDRIVLDRNERGHTLLIVDSTRMTPFLVAEANRAARACEEELRRFTLGDGITTDN